MLTKDHSRNRENGMNFRFLFCACIVLFLTLTIGPAVLFGALLRLPRPWLDAGCILWSRWILKAAGVPVDIKGLEDLPPAPAILVGNHQGLMDILALIVLLPRPPVFVAKKELFRLPIFGQVLHLMGHVCVDRSNRDKAIASINRARERLHQDQTYVVFFPEGTRTRDGQMQPFKKGAFVFALETGLPLIPFAIDGSYQAQPPKTTRLNPGPIHVQVLPPIDTQAYSLEQKEELVALAEMQVKTALAVWSQPHEKAPTV